MVIVAKFLITITIQQVVEAHSEAIVRAKIVANMDLSNPYPEDMNDITPHPLNSYRIEGISEVD